MSYSNKELSKLVWKMQHMPNGQAAAILHSIYAQGYADGHAACCDELAVNDGDEVVTMTIEELRRRMSLGSTLDEQLAEVFRGVKKIK
jgi:hypothetical protein